MIKKLIKIVRGFSPVELVIMVGFAALAAGALIFLATTPQQMAQTEPVNINIKVEGATTASKNAVVAAPKTESRPTTAKAQSSSGENPDPANILSDDAGGWIVYPSGKNWLATGTNTTNRAKTIYDPNLSEETLNEIKGLLAQGVELCAINTKLPEDTWYFWAHTKIVSVDVNKKLIVLQQDKIINNDDPYSIGYLMEKGVTDFSYPNIDIGTFNTDSRNVYWATRNVDGSLAPNGMPTVLLKATNKATPYEPSEFTPFVFPEGDRVTVWNVPITRNVILTGETLSGQIFSEYHDDLNGTPLMTTIKNGCAVFGVNFGGYPFADATNVEIKNLVSIGAYVNFISSFYFDEDGINAKDYPANTNIHDIKIVDLSDPIWGVIEGAINIRLPGKTNVSNCLIRVASSDSLSWGIGFGMDRTGIAEGTIVNNDIEMDNAHFSSYGILLFNEHHAPGGSVLVQNNIVESDVPINLAHNVGNVQILNNVLTGRVFGIEAAHDPEKLTVKGNTINMDTVYDDGSRKNPTVMSEWGGFILNPYTAGFVGISNSGLTVLVGNPAPLSNADVSNNRFTGKANYTVYMGDNLWWPSWLPPAPNTGSGNSFWGNNLSGLNLIPWEREVAKDDGEIIIETVQPYTYYFATTTSGNTVTGGTGGETYVETGNSSNVITGPGLPKSSGIGTIKNPPVNQLTLTAEQQADLDKMKSYLR